MTDQLTPEQRARKEATATQLRARAGALHIAAGQVWEHIGAVSLQNPDRRLRASHQRIRIVQVAGVDQARTTRYVKVDPPRGGNGGYDHQSHRIDPLTLARAYRLVDTAETTNHTDSASNS
ncbi:hypothetical protein [Mycolicibacterium llatzerense]|uniref:hypothetical protein n=1 Tax=Mycolicibacterium llatzerense TaxID=280871 RepID=UPI0021B55996|nr:hypothetical protein [Mycolicibacterium llatzerense]MCT7372153.1 hypothetical protein [Mycolicibacterium llatzerense]